MVSLPKCGALREAVGEWNWVDMMALFNHKLEAISNVSAAAKTFEFLNETLWKDDKRLRKLRNMEMNAEEKAARKSDLFRSFDVSIAIAKDLRLATAVNGLCDGLTAVIEERGQLIDEIDILVERFVPRKMSEFIKEMQGKDTKKLMKLQILDREFELRSREKYLFIDKLKDNMDY
ncbi:hypothetical protein Tco_0453275 [Tanacetum coccineum]